MTKDTKPNVLSENDLEAVTGGARRNDSGIGSSNERATGWLKAPTLPDDLEPAGTPD